MKTANIQRVLTVVALLLPTGLLFGTPTGNEFAGQEAPVIQIIWYDPDERLQVGFEEMTQEVDSIFLPLGIEIEWNSVSGTTFERSDNDILVLLLREKPAMYPLGDHVMGVVGPARPPVIRVFYKEVCKTLGFKWTPIRSGGSEFKRQNTARGIARVLAHEIIHAVAPPHPHANDGLMHRILTQPELRQEEVRVDPACSRAIVGALRETRVPAEN